ncbi:sigma-70 family RNA polymerase sigma factor [Salinibacterium sp. NG22]|uniref:sigma-70 family RNA polymerase sigma factor n=1 Tax=Salinibacterium sp. NG22 TaxID=2792040 RepID=UPI0018CE548A|nr:sigma-70 family RNA polymerase sigma factor [Salinibacterium sp. NG22]MBH0110457.1 sigma-70 family RNA polymerase sigma factor [Salinibacterium sp. NG22]
MSEAPTIETDSSDADLITSVRRGELEAFGTLFARHHECALHYARRLSSSTTLDADDLVAEAFEQILGVLQRGKGPEEFFRAYLYTVIRNSFHARAKADANSVLVDDFEPVEREVITRQHGETDPTIEHFESRVVVRAFGALSENWQAVLWYLDVEGLTPTAVASIMGMKPKAVSMLRLRAREGLRELYLQSHLNELEPLVASDAARDCQEIAKKLGSFTRQTLRRRESEVVLAHVAGCENCAAICAELRDVNRGLLGVIAVLILGGSAFDFVRAAPVHAVTASSDSDVLAGYQATGYNAAIGAPAAAATAARAIPYISRLAATVAAASAAVLATAVIISGAGAGWTETVLAGNSVDDGMTQSQLDEGRREGRETGIDLAGDAASGDGTNAVTTPAPSTPSAVATNTPEPQSGAGSSSTPPSQTPTDPAPIVALPDPVSNGTFDSSGYANAGGQFHPGDNFGGWLVISRFGPPGDVAMQIWSPELGSSFAAPFTNGPWASIAGVIHQEVPTVIGQSYVLTYDTRASGAPTADGQAGWPGGDGGRFYIEGELVDTFVTLSDSAIDHRSLNFTATGHTTRVSIASSNASPVGIDNVSVSASSAQP